MNDFVGVFGVDEIFNRTSAGFAEICRMDLDDVREGNLDKA